MIPMPSRSTPRPKRRRAKTPANAWRHMDLTSRKSTATTCGSFSTPSTWRKGATTENRSSSSRTRSSAKAFRKSKGRTSRTTKLATRKAGGEALQPIAQAMPLLMSGSADLYGSTMNYIKDGGDFTRDTPGGRNIRFGIREHGMCAILNGISYHGLFRASGATFMVFTDYCRAAIRLSALAKLPNVYIFTHDSIGVGE